MTEDQAKLFSKLFDEHYRAVLVYCRRRTHNLEDAADAASTTFMTAWRRIDDLADVEVPLAWLYAVAYRTLANQHRTARRLRALTGRAGRLSSSPVIDTADAALGSSEVARATAALRMLSQVDQEIIRLAAFEDLGHAEIASVLGITTGQARSRLYRARQRLRKHFDGDGAT